MNLSKKRLLSSNEAVFFGVYLGRIYSVSSAHLQRNDNCKPM